MVYRNGECAKCGGLWLIVNRKHMLCRVCNRARLQPEKKRKIILNRKSERQRGIDAELAAIKREMLLEGPFCFTTGTGRELTLSHILPRQYASLITNRVNLVLETFTVHCLYENNKKGFAAAYPQAWAAKLERARSVSEEGYRKLIGQLDK